MKGERKHERLFCEKGFFNIREEILLYPIWDLKLKNIKNPREIKELISNKVEECKDRRRMRSMEIMDDGCEHDPDGDGVMDDAE